MENMAISLKEICDWCRQESREFWEYMLEDDMRERSVTREESLAQMGEILDAMCHAEETYKKERISGSGLVGAEGGLLEEYRAKSAEELTKSGKKPALCGPFMGKAMEVALKTAGSNACMRRIVAAPTAGSCGVLPAVLIPYYESGMTDREQIIEALYVAGAIGEVIRERASLAGAQGGCQAEIGSASAMAAGALAFLQGGCCDEICHSAALALKGLLGLACDPVAGLVEVPCVKRNVIGAVNAISSTDMAMAGIRSVIPPDEVIDAMGEIGAKMDVSLRETAQGGLAATPTGQAISEKLAAEAD